VQRRQEASTLRRRRHHPEATGSHQIRVFFFYDKQICYHVID
jgi:hypothetical protein